MKTSLLAVISPAKLIDDQTHYPQYKCTQPEFSTEAATLIRVLQKLTAADIQKLMAVSHPLAAQAAEQFQQWSIPFSHQHAHPAILMFKGEVYRGLDAGQLDTRQLTFANKHLRILSGLYGILRPLDFAMPYRLMMGTKFSPGKPYKNLYDFWKEKITGNLRESLTKSGVLINLASEEYFRSIDPVKLERRIITCEFLEKKGSKLSSVSTYAKLARGKMARFLIEEKITETDHLKAFNDERYVFQPKLSDENRFIFAR
jgi:cytoplasmic iron level regulating protein YaaA (DUF328/UPF0246 family)